MLLREAIQRLFQLTDDVQVLVFPAIRLSDKAERQRTIDALTSGIRVFVYLDHKLGGEVSLPRTNRSPEFSIDVTILELGTSEERPEVKRFGALEIQTMDFHGSYEHAVKNLQDGLRLHPEQFASIIDQNQNWLSDRIQSPNLANVFKRTFYQMAFKFQLGRGQGCVGTVLAIPKPVWESWRHLLGDPEILRGENSVLAHPSQPSPDPTIAWIISFDLAADPDQGPDRVYLHEVIATSAEALSYWALEVAPLNAIDFALSPQGIPGSIKRRLTPVWPELANRVLIGEHSIAGTTGNASDQENG